jgi:hypothetical protein
VGALLFTYLNPDFHLLRSYIPAIWVRTTISGVVDLTGDVISWTSAPGYVYRVVLKHEFTAWSSNYYSIDWFIDEAASSIDCISFPCFDGINVGFSHLINDEPPVLWFQPAATPGSPQGVAMPTGPPTYWLDETGGL